MWAQTTTLSKTFPHKPASNAVMISGVENFRITFDLFIVQEPELSAHPVLRFNDTNML